MTAISKFLALAVLLSAILCGCENASQKIVADSGWTEIGINVPPKFSRDQDNWTYESKTIRDGTGLEVFGGDLVQIAAVNSSQTDDRNAKNVFWIYVGSDRSGEHWPYLVSDSHFPTSSDGYLGSIRLRQLLIGHRVGDIVLVKCPSDITPERCTEPIPFKAVIGYSYMAIPELADEQRKGRANIRNANGGIVTVYRLTFLKLGKGLKRGLDAEIEIL